MNVLFFNRSCLPEEGEDVGAENDTDGEFVLYETTSPGDRRCASQCHSHRPSGPLSPIPIPGPKAEETKGGFGLQSEGGDSPVVFVRRLRYSIRFDLEIPKLEPLSPSPAIPPRRRGLSSLPSILRSWRRSHVGCDGSLTTVKRLPFHARTLIYSHRFPVTIRLSFLDRF